MITIFWDRLLWCGRRAALPFPLYVVTLTLALDETNTALHGRVPVTNILNVKYQRATFVLFAGTPTQFDAVVLIQKHPDSQEVGF